MAEKAKKNRTTEEKNSIIIALFLFQYSLLIPLVAFVSQTILVAAVGILLLIAALIVNKSFRISAKTLFFHLALFLILLIKVLLDGSEPVVLFLFITIAIPVLFVFSNHFDRAFLLKSCIVLGYINFAVLCMIPFMGRVYSYMRFGYGLLLTPIFMYIDLFHLKRSGRRKAVDIIILAVSLVEIIVFGARGCLLVLAFFLILDSFLLCKEHIIRNLAVLVLLGVMFFNIKNILALLQRIIQKYGFYSYALKKYQMQIDEGLRAASSSRFPIYEEALEKIRRNPFFGNPIIGVDESGNYAHNLFLQVAQDLGIIALVVLVAFLLVCLVKIASKKYSFDERAFLAVLFSVAVGRLLVSSVLWRRPEFWMLICFAFCMVKMVPKDKSQ